MTHAALRIIRDEHQALAAMLRSILLLLAQPEAKRGAPDFASLRAIIFYVDEFPEQRHHRIETEMLFPKLRARTSSAGDVLDHLDDDHAHGERRIRELAHTLLAYEMMGESRREAFEKAAQRYVDFYLKHMRVEEEQILPLAEKVLTQQDWDELGAAFEQNQDPLTGHETPEEYRALFSRIVSAVPAPIGLGRSA